MNDAQETEGPSSYNLVRNVKNPRMECALIYLPDQESQIRDQDSREIVNWQSLLNFWLKQDDTIKRRQGGTGELLLNHPEFKKEVDGDPGFYGVLGTV
jgi:hypothetical protein